jgi:monofunctional biosynthetic peptidoglycan transglycosylase
MMIENKGKAADMVENQFYPVKRYNRQRIPVPLNELSEMRILRKIRRVDLRRGHLGRPQKAVLKLLFNQIILRPALWLGFLGFAIASVLAWRGALPLQAGWMLAVLAFLVLTAFPVLLLRWLTPPRSAFMLQVAAALRRAGGELPLEHRWVRLEGIHPFMRLATIAFEDPDFPVHTGFAVRRIFKALRENRKRVAQRGESTITQQLAKNLFLSPAQTYTRKLAEAYLTLLMECLLPKRRILELYLNFVQLDRDLFGVGAAARRYYDKSADDLTAAEAARLVAVLANPVYYRVDDPSSEVLAKQAFTLLRMEEFGLPYLDLIDGRVVDFVRWALKGYLLTVQAVPPWRAYAAPIQSSPGQRDRFLYDSVINQFRVSTNPRYRQDLQGRGETYCNIFVWDVTKAMGVEIPHWVDGEGNRMDDGEGSELDANGLIRWLESTGDRSGWEAVDAGRAQALANQGFPVVATWKNPGGIGHLAVVRPGDHSETEGPNIAQSGSVNFNKGTVEQGFRERAAKRDIVYFYHH